MSLSVRLSGALLASAALLAACASGPKHPTAAATGAPGTRAQVDTEDGTGSPQALAEQKRRRSYEYNTSRWSFAPAIDIERELATSDPGAVGRDIPIAARILLAQNLAAVGRLPEAGAALDAADQLLQQQGAQLPPAEVLKHRVSLLIARSVVAGNAASRMTGPARQAKFEEAVQLAQQASQVAGERAGAGAGAGHTATRSEAGIVLDPAAAVTYNAAAARRGIGDIVARPLNETERLSLLKARAEYTRAAALISLDRAADARVSNADATLALSRVPPDVGSWMRALVLEQQAELEVEDGQRPRLRR